MRSNALASKGKRKYTLKISKDAVKEYISRIEINIENNLPLIAQDVFDNGRKIIKEDDITNRFGYVDTKIVGGDE